MFVSDIAGLLWMSEIGIGLCVRARSSDGTISYGCHMVTCVLSSSYFRLWANVQMTQAVKCCSITDSRLFRNISRCIQLFSILVMSLEIRQERTASQQVPAITLFYICNNCPHWNYKADFGPGQRRRQCVTDIAHELVLWSSLPCKSRTRHASLVHQGASIFSSRA